MTSQVVSNELKLAVHENYVFHLSIMSKKHQAKESTHNQKTKKRQKCIFSYRTKDFAKIYI